MPIITISRGTMSGGQLLADCLSRKLGLPAISREALTEAALEFGFSEEELNVQLTETPGFFDSLKRKRRIYLLALRSAMIQHAQKEGYIYHGHAGHLLLKGLPQVLRVRLIAPLEYRVKMLLSKNVQMSEEEARRHIADVDRRRTEWTRFLYQVDWNDASIYDIVLNLVTISVEGACEIVAEALKLPEFEDSPERKARLADCALASRVEAVLGRDRRTTGLELTAEAKDGKIRIRGSFQSAGLLSHGFKRAERDVREVSLTVEGVESVETDLQDAPIPIE